MTIFHLSTECYPIAKVGGLADVVGALPKYQNKIKGIDAKVVMPWYNKPFVHKHDFEIIFEGNIYQNNTAYPVQVLKEKSNSLGFELYLIKIPTLLDRDQPYGYWDEGQQFLAFQHGVLHWLSTTETRPDILHCHDYHTGYIPFMVEHCPEFSFLKGTKTIGTIHNGEYQGQQHWSLLPYFPTIQDHTKLGLLDWDRMMNPLACMIKCCHAFTAVSYGYLEELFQSFKGLEGLVRHEHPKAFGIINGIDTEVWSPTTDPFLHFHYSEKDFHQGKSKNKENLCKEYNLDPQLPLFAFIGRFAGEKGADLLPNIVEQCMLNYAENLNIIILGSGNSEIEQNLKFLNSAYPNFALELGYKEPLSHQIYASADFLLMPSRVEPCGLNQMYAMRYGTIPIVRYTGGLKDTVQDISTGGSGLNFGNATAEDVLHAIHRALHIYKDKDLMKQLSLQNMKLDFSWEKSAENYLQLYQKLLTL